MKLIIVLLITCLMQVSAAGFAQRLSYSKKNATLEEIFKQITLQTGYNVLYSPQKIEESKKIDVNFKNTDLKEALDQITKNQKLEYTIDSKNIIIKPEEPSFIDNIIARFQSIDVRGKVVDSLGVGIAGATVSVKNGKGSTSTSANGDFYLKNIEEGSLLVITFMGYVTKEQAASKDFNYVILKQSTSQLDEVLVQAYGTTTRRLSTGNIAMITSKEIAQQNINNPLLALQGRVAGLEITQVNGMPGAGVKMKIRGQYTLDSRFGGNDPLIIVDGVPYENNMAGLGAAAGGVSGPGSIDPGIMSVLSFINPNEIESISILKDGDATSIYGSRGSKGVVLITTKKGRSGQAIVDVTVNSGWQDMTKKLNLLNTQQYLEIRKEAFKNDGLSGRLSDPVTFGATYPDMLLWDQQKYTDWQEKLLGRTARYNNYQGAVSGGSNVIQYRLGGTYHNENYVFPGDNYDKKGSAKMSVTGSSDDQKFSATFGAEYMFNKNSTPPTDMTKLAMSLAPNAPELYNANGELNWEPNPYSSVPGRGSFVNPLALLERPTTSNINNLVSNFSISYSPLPKLIIKTTGGYVKLNGKSFIVLNNAASNDPTRQATVVRRAFYMAMNSESWSVEPQLTYGIKLGQSVFDFLLGGTLQNQDRSTDQISGNGFNSDAVMQTLSQATQHTDISNTLSQYRYNAVFGRLNYNWKDKYLFNLSGRRDGSSRFGPSRQFGNFWSLGTGWIFTKEKPLERLSTILSFGKIRFTYGSSGNDGIGDYQFMELYNPVTEVTSYRGVKLLRSAGLSNPYYGWEVVKKMEFGLDLGFFNDRVNIMSAFFRNRSSSMLGNLQVAAIAGPSSFLTVNRSALVETRGWEFNVNTNNVSTKAFMWNSALNFYFMRNRRLADNDGDRTKPGLGEAFYGYASIITFNGVDSQTGQYNFLDANGIPTFDSDAAAFGQVRTEPVVSGGINNGFKYKNLSLDVFLQFTKQQGKNYLYQFDLPGKTNQPVEVMNRWQNPGDEAVIQRMTLLAGGPIVQAYNDVRDKSSAAWVDASFVRLKTVSLSYNLGNFAQQKLRLKNLRIFAQGQNLYTWTKYKGTDPETQNPYVLPPLRVISAGFQLSL